MATVNQSRLHHKSTLLDWFCISASWSGLMAASLQCFIHALSLQAEGQPHSSSSPVFFAKWPSVDRENAHYWEVLFFKSKPLVIISFGCLDKGFVLFVKDCLQCLCFWKNILYRWCKSKMFAVIKVNLPFRVLGVRRLFQRSGWAHA